MALNNSTSIYQLKSINQTATFPHKGDFKDGCIDLLNITGSGRNTTFAFANLPASTLDCGPADFRSRFSRYFDWVHDGAKYPASFGVNTTAHIAEIVIGDLRNGYIFDYGTPVVASTTTTASSTATAKSSATSDSASASASTASAASASTADATVASASAAASNSAPAPSVVYVAPTNAYVAPKPAPSNLYKGAAMKESLSAAAIAAVFALIG
ncbi:hypothetical protein HDU81_004561 [Chytriomyces hyalinus]|nr:hypothetical protein HDU81_004561 [Chytriomyces hyalinus]